MVEAGELNRPLDSDPTSEKLLDFPIKSVGSNDFSEDAGGPKRAEKVHENREKPDRVRSVKRKPRKP